MIDTVVISCQTCYRQYVVNRDMAGKPAHCGRCDGYFMVHVAVPCGRFEEAVVLDDSVEYRDDFFREGCAELARNVAELLRMAGEPASAENVKAMVSTIPRSFSEAGSESWRDKPFTHFMQKACSRTPRGGRFAELFHYFIDYIPGRRSWKNDMLLGAFLGVLSVEFDKPKSTELSVVEKPVRKPRLFAAFRKAVGL